MNILLLVPRMNIGGAESHVAMLAPLLQKNGHNVIVVSGGGQLADKLAAKGISQIFLPLRLNTSLAAFFLKFIIKKYDIELVHAHSAAAGITAVKCKLKYLPDLPVLYTAHGLFGSRKERILMQCDKIIAVSQYVYHIALENGAIPEKVKVIYNGVDTEKFSPHDNRNDLRKRLNIADKTFCLAITARIKNLRNKGHQHLIKLLSEQTGAADWHLLIIGTGKGKWKLRYQIWKNGLTDRVHFLGHKPDVENYLSAADVIVLPSRFETFGLVLAEGMAMKKPALAYDVGGTGEVITDGKTGYLIPSGNCEILYSKLKLLAANTILRLQMGQAARNDIISRFSPEKMFDEIISLYNECSQPQK
ncbi:glycosyltransferase family 4 protein [Pectinatus haikarae]|uniref:glycosyltransferase family 4 protein n=1 Tax=Pectinatus haikarae TaxID=349096 RepID=UPI0018C81D2F|nr:glycosyltransferase family 4 protein [Pectinatus haikarae]